PHGPADVLDLHEPVRGRGTALLHPRVAAGGHAREQGGGGQDVGRGASHGVPSSFVHVVSFMTRRSTSTFLRWVAASLRVSSGLPGSCRRASCTSARA